MKTMKKLSIIMPVYNVADYLPESLDSILAQTLTDFELICVNDGSTDTSLDILREYEAKDARIKVLDVENGGPGRARNRGTDIAVGEYIGFVDGDDFADPHMFEKLYDKAVKYDADVAIGNVYLYYASTGAKQLFRPYDLYQELSDCGSFTARSKPLVLEFVGLWDRIFKRSFLEENKIRNPEGRFYEDHLPSFQTSVLARRMVVVNEPLYYYRQNRKGSTINRETKEDFFKFQFLDDFEEVRAFLVQKNVYKVFQHTFLEYKVGFAIAHQNNMQSGKTYRQFFKKLRSLLSDDDFEEIRTLGFYPDNRRYLEQLEQNHPGLAYLRFKLSKLYYKDYLYVYWRLPKMKNYFKIKRRHFFLRTEFAALHREFAEGHHGFASVCQECEKLRKALSEKEI